MSENRLAVGIDFGSATIQVGVVFQSHVIDRGPSLATAEYDGPASLMEALVRVVGELREQHPGLAAVGIGLPGLVDYDRGTVHGLESVPGWEAVPLQRIFADRSGLATVIDNRANCMAVAEWRCGAARGFRDFLFMKIDLDVGGAVVANGHLVRGARHVAGEVGRMVLGVGAGERRSVGECLGAEVLASEARKAYAAAGMMDKAPADLTVAALIAAAHRRDPVAVAHWKRVASLVAVAAANCCSLLNPEAVVLGGSLIRAAELLFNPLQEELCGLLPEPFVERLMVLPASFGSDAGMIGAAALALENPLLTV